MDRQGSPASVGADWREGQAIKYDGVRSHTSNLDSMLRVIYRKQASFIQSVALGDLSPIPE